MIKCPDELIHDLKTVFKKYNIEMDVSPEYDGRDMYMGEAIEIKTKTDVVREDTIFIADMEELADRINNG